MAEALMEAAIKDDPTDLEANLASISSKGDDYGPWFHRACQENSIRFVKEVIIRRPDLAWRKNQDGQASIHMACQQQGRVELVKALVENNPSLCFLRDEHHLIPLHIATVKGNIEVVKKLLEACPNSLAELTPFDQSALHLAAKYGQNCAFEVLLEETFKRKQEKILHKKDYEGNNVLQIAVIHKRIQILQWLIVDNPNRRCMFEVNSKNGRGFTALDLHYENLEGTKDIAVTELLYKAGARRGQSSHSQLVLLDTFTVSPALYIMSVLIAGFTYVSVFKINDTHAEIKSVRFRDIMLHTDLLPNDFYSIILRTAVFTASMVGAVVNLWSVMKGWTFSSRVFSLVGIGAFFLSFAFTVKQKVPKFWVTAGSFTISSFWMVWFYDQFLIHILVIIWLAAKKHTQIRRIFGKRNRIQPVDE